MQRSLGSWSGWEEWGGKLTPARWMGKLGKRQWEESGNVRAGQAWPPSLQAGPGWLKAPAVGTLLL